MGNNLTVSEVVTARLCFVFWTLQTMKKLEEIRGRDSMARVKSNNDAACMTEGLNFQPVPKPYQRVGVKFILLLY